MYVPNIEVLVPLVSTSSSPGPIRPLEKFPAWSTGASISTSESRRHQLGMEQHGPLEDLSIILLLLFSFSLLLFFFFDVSI